MQMLQKILAGLGCSQPELWAFAVILVLVVVAFGLAFAFVLYQLKLFVPSSRLFDQEYVAASIRNSRRLMIGARLVFGLSAGAAAVMLLLHHLGVVQSLRNPVFLFAVVVAFLTMLPTIGVGRHTPSLQDAERRIERVRMRHYANAVATPQRRRRAWLLAALFLAVLILLGALLSLHRGMGYFGVIWRFALCVLAILLWLAGLRQVCKEWGGLGLKRRVSWWAFSLLWLACTALWMVPSARDLVTEPVTQQVEVVSFTRRWLRVESIETGERISMRIGGWEKSLTLRELWDSWKASRAFYGDAVGRATHPAAEDQRVLCTVTYYPHTKYRVAVEYVQILPQQGGTGPFLEEPGAGAF